MVKEFDISGYTNLINKLDKRYRSFRRSIENRKIKTTDRLKKGRSLDEWTNFFNKKDIRESRFMQ